MKTNFEVSMQKLNEAIDGLGPDTQAVFRKRVAARVKAAREIGLHPAVAYGPVTSLTAAQRDALHDVRCPVKGHSHTLEVLYTVARDTDGQLFSRLACHQGATYRWELEHGTYCARIPCPHWGFSKKDDAPNAGWRSA